MALHRPVTIAGATVALLGSSLLALPSAEAAPADLPGRLVLYHAEYPPGQPQTTELATSTPAGADQQQLIPLGEAGGLSDAADLDWSADGQRVAFTGRVPDRPLPDVWVMNADGSGQTRLTDGDDYELAPTWSPDGSTIAYIDIAEAAGDTTIWLMDADGGNQRLLYDWPDTSSPDSLDWHPTDNTLLVGASRSVYTLDIGDPADDLLWASGGTDMGHPRWSPDGTRAAVSVEVTTTVSQLDVFVIDAADGSATNLTDTVDLHESFGGWSPDGSAMAWNEVTRFFVQNGVFVHELADGTTTRVIEFDGDTEYYGIRDWIAVAPADPDDVDTPVGPGDTVSTDPEGDGATAEDPVETAVTSPNAGTVTVDERTLSATPPANYEFLGQEVAITAPSATAADPLVLAFRVDASLVPGGTAPGDLVPFRNGTAVPECTGPAGTASPDPCLASAVLETDGDVTLTVLTSAASLWNFGVSTVPPDTMPPTISLTAPRQGASYGRDQAVTVDYECSDTGSGVTRCQGTRPDGTLLNTANLGTGTFRVDAEDAAGNDASRTATYRVVARRTLTPSVTCVIRGSGGWWTARFGYNNRNTYPLTLAVGTRNGFTTAPAGRGQPTYFAPGTVSNAVQVQFRTTVAWRLDGTTVTARTNARRC